MRLVPAITGSGESVLVTAMSARATTAVVAVEELLPVLGSVTGDVIVPVLDSIVPSGVLAGTCTTRLKTATCVLSSVSFLAVTVPFEPIDGVVLVHPAGAAKDTKVVPAGSESLITRSTALSPPLLVTVIE